MNSSESAAFRDEAAKQLNRLPHDKRAEKLREIKNDPNYGYAARRIMWDREKTQRKLTLESAIAGAESISDLRERVRCGVFLVDNPVKGNDHAEHLDKRLEMAVFFGNSELLPKEGNLRQTYEVLATREGREVTREINPEAYLLYLSEERYPELNLTTAELENITSKINPDTLASLDVDIEKSIILLNSFEGTTTRFSCAGHGEPESHKPEFYASAYLTLNTNDGKLCEEIRESFGENPHVEIEWDALEQDGGDLLYDIDIRFSLVPPKEWLEAHHKRTVEQIVEDADKTLAEGLGMDIAEVREITKQRGRRTELALSMQDRFLKENPRLAREQYGFNSLLLNRFSHLSPASEMRKEYEEYNRSDEAKSLRDRFLRSLEDCIATHRVRKNLASAV